MPRVKLFDENEVLDKAIELFWTQGYAATSIQDLVKHLGINRASLYSTYGDKEKLFKKAFEQYRKRNIDGLTQFLQSHDDVKKGLEKLFQRAIGEDLKDKDSKGCFVVNTTTELIPNSPEILNSLKENKASIEKIFFDYLSLGVARGQLSSDKDLKTISSLFFTYYSGLRVVTKVDTTKAKLHKGVSVFLSILD